MLLSANVDENKPQLCLVLIEMDGSKLWLHSGMPREGRVRKITVKFSMMRLRDRLFHLPQEPQELSAGLSSFEGPSVTLIQKHLHSSSNYRRI